MANRGIPIRRSLLLNLSAGVLLLGGALLAISLLATERTVARLSGSLTHRVIATTDAEIMRFFEPVQAAIEISAARAADGEFESFPLAELDGFFRPLVERLPQVSSVMYAHADGDEYMLLQTATGWASRLTRPNEWGGEELWREWAAGDMPGAGVRQAEDYDSRTRPWHAGALEQFRRIGVDGPVHERVSWTPPYRFFTTGEPGVTASIAFPLASGRIAILGLDILLADISRYTRELLIGHRGKVFVLRGAPDDPEGLVVLGLPADERFADDSVLLDFILSPPDGLGGPVGSFATEALKLSEAPPGTPVQFDHEGEPWWGEIARSRLLTSDDIWVGSVVPEAELLAGLPKTQLIVVGTTALVLLLAGLQALRLARRYSRPLEALTDRGNRMQRLNFEPVGGVESRIREIRNLSATLEGMRAALQSFSAQREDLRVARSIRDMALPQGPAASERLDIATWHEPAEEVGGECYDLLDAGESGSRVYAVLFDFPGTGVPAAVRGSELRAAFRVAARAGEDLAAIAARVREFVRRDLPEVGHVRCWFLSFDVQRGLVSWLGFGDSALFHVRAGAASRLADGGVLISESSTAAAPSAGELTLREGDVLVLASDGVLDAISDDRRRYGAAEFPERLAASGGEPADAILAGIRADLERFDAGPRRDRTVVVIRLRA